MNNSIKILFFLVLIALTGCGEEVGRIACTTINQESNWPSVDLSVEAGTELGVWAEVDVKYEGNPGLYYLLEAKHESGEVSQYQVDPFDKNVTLNEVKTSVGSSTTWRFEGKNINITLEKAGKYTLSGCYFTPSPSFKFKQLDIVLMQ